MLQLLRSTWTKEPASWLATADKHLNEPLHDTAWKWTSKLACNYCQAPCNWTNNCAPVAQHDKALCLTEMATWKSADHSMEMNQQASLQLLTKQHATEQTTVHQLHNMTKHWPTTKQTTSWQSDEKQLNMPMTKWWNATEHATANSCNREKVLINDNQLRNVKPLN
jgi:hypothetical protein